VLAQAEAQHCLTQVEAVLQQPAEGLALAADLEGLAQVVALALRQWTWQVEAQGQT